NVTGVQTCALPISCSEPACTWDSPREDRTKTSHSGHAALRFSCDMSLGSNQVCISGVLLTTCLFFGVGSRCFAHPGTVIVGGTTVLHTLHTAWTSAFNNRHEFIPVQFTKIIVATFFVPLQIRVWQG